MYGAILGDMIGSPYEFDIGNKTKDFPLFVEFVALIYLSYIKKKMEVRTVCKLHNARTAG